MSKMTAIIGLACTWHNISPQSASLNKKIMTLLDISGAGLFNHSSELLHVLGAIAKLIVGSFMIVALAAISFIGITVYSLSRGYRTSSIMLSAKTFVHATAYLIGASMALAFVMVATMFFHLAVFKLLFIALLITFAVAFLIRETFLFLVLKRFGKYVMYFTALQYIKEKVYTNGQQENQP
jgi:hypothetical protein